METLIVSVPLSHSLSCVGCSPWIASEAISNALQSGLFSEPGS